MSTGLLRFGEVSLAMLLKVIVPLLIFYLGYGSIAKEREEGTLKLLIGQGAPRKEIIFGKWLGLWSFSLIFLAIVFAIVFGIVVFQGQEYFYTDSLFRCLILLTAYGLYFLGF